MNKDAKNIGRLIVDRQSPALREALWRLIDEAKQDGGVLAPVTVVGPSQYANLSLRQELGRSGFANVRFILLPMLAELLGGASMARAGRRPLTPVLEAVAVRGALQSAREPLAQVKEHRSTQASLRESFRQLRQVSGAVLRELEKPALNPDEGAGGAPGNSSAFTANSVNAQMTAGTTMKTWRKRQRKQSPLMPPRLFGTWG